MEDPKTTIIHLFECCQSLEEIYNKIMDIGRAAKSIECDYALPEYQVSGCQSVLYLKAEFYDGKMFFKAHSEALISMGLAQLLVLYYSGQDPEAVLKTPPDFLQELNIPNALTPSRANGLYHIHLRIKQEAVKALTASI